MRIAVLFSGRVAGYLSNYESSFEGLLKGQEVYFFLSHSPELQEDLEGFKQKFNPKILNNDEIIYPDVSNYPKKEDGTNKHNTMCMYFNRKRVFEDLKYIHIVLCLFALLLLDNLIHLDIQFRHCLIFLD